MRAKHLVALMIALAMLITLAVPAPARAEGGESAPDPNPGQSTRSGSDCTLYFDAPGWNDTYAVIGFGGGMESQTVQMEKNGDRFSCIVPADAVSLYFNIGSDDVRTTVIDTFEDGDVWKLTGEYTQSDNGIIFHIVRDGVEVIFMCDGEEVYTISINRGSAIPESKLPAEPTKEGYTFIGWALEGSDEPLDLSGALFDEGVTLYALWWEGGAPVGVTYSATLTLRESIDINFYVDGVDPADAGKYTVSYHYEDDPGSENSVTLQALTPLADGQYRIQVGAIHPYQMWRTVVISVCYDGVPVDGMPITYSASRYFHNTIQRYESEIEYTALVDLCKAALAYGSCAQVYFNGKQYRAGNGTMTAYVTNVDDLVNDAGYTVHPDRPTDYYTAEVSGSLDGVALDTASLILGTETSIKIYLTGDASQVRVTCRDDREVSRRVSELQAEADGRTSFKITGIKSYELSRIYTITIADENDEAQALTLTYSPYAYARSVWDQGNAFAALCQALVAYGDAANGYWMGY